MNEKTSKSRLTNFINTEFRKEPKDIIKTTTLTTTTTTGTRQDDPDLGYQYHGPTPVTSVLAHHTGWPQRTANGRSRSTTLTSQQRTASADMLTPPEFSLTGTRGKHRRRVTTVRACVPGWLDRFTSRRPTGWWHSRLEGVDIPGPSNTSSESPQLKPTPSSDDSTLPPPCPYVFCGSSGRPCSDRTSSHQPGSHNWARRSCHMALRHSSLTSHSRVPTPGCNATPVARWPPCSGSYACPPDEATLRSVRGSFASTASRGQRCNAVPATQHTPSSRALSRGKRSTRVSRRVRHRPAPPVAPTASAGPTIAHEDAPTLALIPPSCFSPVVVVVYLPEKKFKKISRNKNFFAWPIPLLDTKCKPWGLRGFTTRPLWLNYSI